MVDPSQVGRTTWFALVGVLASGCVAQLGDSGGEFDTAFDPLAATPADAVPFERDEVTQTDLLWRNSSGTALVRWRMAGAAWEGDITLASPSAAWSVGATGDFDGDGFDDIVWRNGDRTAGSMWLMDGDIRRASATLIDPGPGWELRASADLDRDGRSDLIWQGTTGTLAVWFMNGGTRAGTASIAALAPAAFVLEGAGDFDGNGCPDLVLRDRAAGRTVIRARAGERCLADAATGRELEAVSSGWDLAAVADMDVDGDPDLLWRGSSGQLLVWRFVGVQSPVADRLTLSRTAGSGWILAGTMRRARSQAAWLSLDGSHATGAAVHDALFDGLEQEDYEQQASSVLRPASGDAFAASRGIVRYEVYLYTETVHRPGRGDPTIVVVGRSGSDPAAADSIRLIGMHQRADTGAGQRCVAGAVNYDACVLHATYLSVPILFHWGHTPIDDARPLYASLEGAETDGALATRIANTVGPAVRHTLRNCALQTWRDAKIAGAALWTGCGAGFGVVARARVATIGIGGLLGFVLAGPLGAASGVAAGETINRGAMLPGCLVGAGAFLLGAGLEGLTSADSSSCCRGHQLFDTSAACSCDRDVATPDGTGGYTDQPLFSSAWMSYESGWSNPRCLYCPQYTTRQEGSDSCACDSGYLMGWRVQTGGGNTATGLGTSERWYSPTLPTDPDVVGAPAQDVAAVCCPDEDMTVVALASASAANPQTDWRPDGGWRTVCRCPAGQMLVPGANRCAVVPDGATRIRVAVRTRERESRRASFLGECYSTGHEAETRVQRSVAVFDLDAPAGGGWVGVPRIELGGDWRRGLFRRGAPQCVRDQAPESVHVAAMVNGMVRRADGTTSAASFAWGPDRREVSSVIRTDDSWNNILAEREIVCVGVPGPEFDACVTAERLLAYESLTCGSACDFLSVPAL